MIYELIDRFRVQAPREESWEFFCNPLNLPRNTPPWMSFTVLSRGDLKPRRGKLLDYRMSWLGIPVRWRSLVIEHRPPRLLTYVQARGPYGFFYHQHRFRGAADGGTEILDRVIYRLPFGIFGDAMHGLVVRRQLLSIFRHRRAMADRHLGLVPPISDIAIRPAGRKLSRD